MTRIRRPDSGKPRVHQIVWGNRGGSSRVAAGAGKSGSYLDDLAASGPPLTPRSVVGEGEAAGLILLSSCLPAPGRQRGFWQHAPLCCPAYSGQDACVASQPGQPAAGPGAARGGPAIERGDRVAAAAGSRTAAARGARVGCSRQLPGRCAEAAPGAAARGLARGPVLAAAVGGGGGGGGIDTAMGLNDPADPGGDGDAVEIGGPLPAAPIELARSGSAQDEPRAPQEAAGVPEPRTGQGRRRGCCRPPTVGGGPGQPGRAVGFRR
jgi:hypothetical protein